MMLHAKGPYELWQMVEEEDLDDLVNTYEEWGFKVEVDGKVRESSGRSVRSDEHSSSEGEEGQAERNESGS